MIEKVLIANRGEIACRIIRCCREMGITAVSLFTPPDQHSPHVALADEAVALVGTGGYLDSDQIIAAAQQVGADAVHPGYGFLAENSEFAAACVAAGLIFVGPRPETIALMGSKTAARQLVRGLGLPVVGGYDGAEQSLAALSAAAAEIGYPLLVKAAAGGGGVGMRRADVPEALAEAVAAARQEAVRAFGDGLLLLERYLTAVRHIEVQILADQHGHVVHCFERDCSVQRRRQKVVEEAPAVGLADDVRRGLHAAAVQIGQAVGYVGAGTVEFLLDGHDNFYFLEMNTRLQVEHPVTEAITGLDLVRLQLQIADGQPLPLTQADIVAHGHAIEARLYAEDPANGFAPSSGRIVGWQPPTALRCDSGIGQGSEVSVYYDPLLAKVVAHGATRGEAVRKLGYGLGQTAVFGPITNIPFLQDVVRHPDFVAGRTTTTFLAEAFGGWKRPLTPATRHMLAAVGTVWQWQQAGGAVDPFAGEKTAVFAVGDTETTTRYTVPQPNALLVGVDGARFEVELVDWRSGNGTRTNADERRFGADFSRERFQNQATCRERPLRVQGKSASQNSSSNELLLRLNGHQQWFWLVAEGNRLFIHAPSLGGHIIEPRSRFQSRVVAAAAAGGYRATMPGRVVRVLVGVGTAVQPGDALLVLESMKMEHMVRAGEAGVVLGVLTAVGELVEAGQVLVEIGEGEW